MNQTANFPPLANPFLAWTDFVLLSAQMMMSSVQAIGYRTSRMLLAGDTPAVQDEQEFDATGEEKASLAVESVQSATQGLFKLGADLVAMTHRQMYAGLPLMMSLAAVPQSGPSARGNGPVPGKQAAAHTSVSSPARTNVLSSRARSAANGKRASKPIRARALRKPGAHHQR